MSKKVNLTLLTLAAFLFLGFSSTAIAAPPTTVINTCNYTIDSPGNYELGGDLTCNNTNGIRITSSRVKLFLNGYTIEGSLSSSTHSGIYVQNGSRITISGPGRITGFSLGCPATCSSLQRGILLSPGINDEISRVTISGLILDGNGRGVNINGGDTSSVNIVNNIIVENDFQGIYIFNPTHDNTIEQNEVLFNGDAGIYVANNVGTGNTIVRNNASYNAGAGIHVALGAEGTVIDSNIAFGGPQDILDNNLVGTNEITGNTCLVGSGHDDCDEFGNFDIDH